MASILISPPICYNQTMTGLIIVVAVFLFLFLLSFYTRCRFGLLGLGLAAGVLLNQLVGSLLIPPVEALNIDFSPLSSKDVVTIALTVLPSLLLMIAGPKQHVKMYRFISSFLYALTATALILFPLTTAFPVDDPAARNIISFVDSSQLPILTFGIILAIADILFPNAGKK